MASLRIGSRGSQLAMWQANYVASQLRERGHAVAIEIIKTTGDKIIDVALAQVGAKGMFTKEIEEALTSRHIDLAVHSLKDLPTEVAPGYEIAAILPREDSRDVLVSAKFHSLTELPESAHIGTSSLRRQAQLKAVRPDVRISHLRGNVDTRLRKLETGEYDAIILAAAGLKRLGKTELVREPLDPMIMCPAAGQGALAIEIRKDNVRTKEAVSFMDDQPSRATAACERAVLKGLGGGCQVPIGAYARMEKNKLVLLAIVASPDGSRVIRQHGSGEDPDVLGSEVAKALLAKGAQAILDMVNKSEAAIPQQP